MFTNVSIRRIAEDEVPEDLDMPKTDQQGFIGVDRFETINAFDGDKLAESMNEKLVIDVPDMSHMQLPAVSGLIKLSDEVRTKWHTVLNLETIKVNLFYESLSSTCR